MVEEFLEGTLDTGWLTTSLPYDSLSKPTVVAICDKQGFFMLFFWGVCFGFGGRVTPTVKII